MAKIVWWLSVIIIALINEVAPFHMQEQTFYYEDYYTSTLGVDNPASIYAQFYGLDFDARRVCQTAPMYQNAVPDYKYNMYGSSAYFLLTKEEVSETDLLSFNVPEGEILPICIPYAYTITSSPKESARSQNISVKCSFGTDEYDVHIVGMECWYCCYNHGIKPECGFYSHYGIDAESYKGVFPANTIVGFANSQTTITINNSAGKQINFTQFLNGTGNDEDATKDNQNAVITADNPEWTTTLSTFEYEEEETTT